MSDNNNINQNQKAEVNIDTGQIKNSNVNITSIIEDQSGGISSIRVLMLLWGVGVFIIWAAGSVVAMWHGVYVFPTIPAEVITILLGVTGIKTVQRFGEK